MTTGIFRSLVLSRAVASSRSRVRSSTPSTPARIRSRKGDRWRSARNRPRDRPGRWPLMSRRVERMTRSCPEFQRLDLRRGTHICPQGDSDGSTQRSDHLASGRDRDARRRGNDMTPASAQAGLSTTASAACAGLPGHDVLRSTPASESAGKRRLRPRHVGRGRQPRRHRLWRRLHGRRSRRPVAGQPRDRRAKGEHGQRLQPAQSGALDGDLFAAVQPGGSCTGCSPSIPSIPQAVVDPRVHSASPMTRSSASESAASMCSAAGLRCTTRRNSRRDPGERRRRAPTTTSRGARVIASSSTMCRAVSARTATTTSTIRASWRCRVCRPIFRTRSAGSRARTVSAISASLPTTRK